MKVWQSVASGLLGGRTFQEGKRAARLGLAQHYFIAFAAVFAFRGSAVRFPIILTLPIIAGASYGIIVFSVMTLIVVPLSATPKRPQRAPGSSS